MHAETSHFLYVVHGDTMVRALRRYSETNTNKVETTENLRFRADVERLRKCKAPKVTVKEISISARTHGPMRNGRNAEPTLICAGLLGWSWAGAGLELGWSWAGVGLGSELLESNPHQHSV